MTGKKYMCVGENFCDDIRMGFCGDVHTLKKWIELLFPNNPEQAIEYFDGDSDKFIIEYLLKNKGKRLESVEKWR